MAGVCERPAKTVDFDWIAQLQITHEVSIEIVWCRAFGSWAPADRLGASRERLFHARNWWLWTVAKTMVFGRL